jgi:hypothetical protein
LCLGSADGNADGLDLRQRRPQVRAGFGANGRVAAIESLPGQFANVVSDLLARGNIVPRVHELAPQVGGGGGALCRIGRKPSFNHGHEIGGYRPMPTHLGLKVGQVVLKKLALQRGSGAGQQPSSGQKLPQQGAAGEHIGLRSQRSRRVNLLGRRVGQLGRVIAKALKE